MNSLAEVRLKAGAEDTEVCHGDGVGHLMQEHCNWVKSKLAKEDVACVVRDAKNLARSWPVVKKYWLWRLEGEPLSLSALFQNI